MSRLVSWESFREEEFEPPYPNKRKVKGWIKTGEIKGRIIGNDIFIDAHAFHNHEASVHDQAMELLGG